MEELANHIVNIGKQNNLTVRNLHLHKVMYFTIGMHIRHEGFDQLVLDTYDIPFRKWRYGPCVETIYYRFNVYGDQDITTKESGTYYDKYAVWDNLIKKLLQIEMYRLIRLSIDMKSYAEYERERTSYLFSEVYTLEEISKDFTEDL